MSRTLIIITVVLAFANHARAQATGTGPGPSQQAGAKDLYRAQKMAEQLDKRFELPNKPKSGGWVKGGSGSSAKQKSR